MKLQKGAESRITRLDANYRMGEMLCFAVCSRKNVNDSIGFRYLPQQFCTTKKQV